MILVRLLFLLLILWAENIYAAGESISSQDIQPQITAEVVDSSDQPRIWGTFRMKVLIKNTTDSEGVAINSVTVVKPPLICIDDISNNRTDVSLTHLQQKSEFEFEFKPCDGATYFKNFFDILFYRPRIETFMVNIKYHSLADRNERTADTIFFPVKFGASKLSILLGSILGAFCSSLFIVLYDERQRRQANPPSQQPFHQLSSDIFFRSLRAAVTLLILIPLLFVTSDIKLPLTIAIEDFWGGFALGLFVDKLAVTLYEKLTK